MSSCTSISRFSIVWREAIRAQNAGPSTGVAVPDTSSPDRTTGLNPGETRRSVVQGSAAAVLPSTDSIGSRIRQAAEKLRDADFGERLPEDGGGDLGDVDLIYVPEPSSLLLLVVGLAVAALVRRRR